jgi:hypothetical protein
MTYKKSFKRFLSESKEKYYTMDLSGDMTKEEVTKSMNQLLPLVLKMLTQDDVHITIEPLTDEMDDE